MGKITCAYPDCGNVVDVGSLPDSVKANLQDGRISESDLLCADCGARYA